LPFFFPEDAVKDKKKIIAVSIAVTVVVILLGLVVMRLLESKLFAAKESEAAKKNAVWVTEVRPGTVKDTLFFTGDVHAEKEALVYTLVPGRVTTYNYKEGQKVAKGAPLVILEREETWDQFKPVIVEAPISGTVAVNYLKAGDRATPQTPLALVVGGNPIKVFIRVPDTELGRIREGMSTDVTVPTVPGKVYAGVVTRVSTVIERTSRTAEVEISVAEHDPDLRAGMFGDVTIILSKKDDALVIPFESLLFEKEGRQGPYCFVIVDGTAKKRLLVLGITQDSLVEVMSGLSAGDKVVTLGKENLSDGSPAVIVPGE
jgi:multidrug efflux pump subunit AcrA (membrane-fusion protein)